ncbi:transcription factor [Ganoderma sinense ZZ0214-1]|uniref:Transcription factor n=1 Tax=Ganoderma sinense ZZ0214-1 TaxID=1077348 RepID=A0A2G8RLW0_9APHY|nr:transcription factor [Ganoderma sinense ZZ0214-1]
MGPSTPSAGPSQPNTAHSSPEAPYPTVSQPIDIPWRRSGDGTYAPLRTASISSRAAERGPTPGPSAPRPEFPADRRSATTSHDSEASYYKGKSKAARRTESERPASVLGRKRRRRRGEREKDPGGSSENSEYAYAPKSKKTLIACHFCRARKLRCDGQKPACANCLRRGNACTYEPEPRRRGPAKKKPEGKDDDKDDDEPHDKAKDKEKEKAKRVGRRGRASASGARARRARHGSARPAEDANEMSASPSLGQGTSSSFPYTRSAFEPRLSEPMPSYPGQSYRPPSPSSSYGAVPVAFRFLSVRPGPSRGAASAPESGQSSTASAPESTQSSVSNASAPESMQSSTASSVPDSEDGVYEDMDYFDYEEFYGHASPRGRRSQ